MCFWDEMAFFNCDGTVERQKHLCKRVPHDGLRAGVEICKNYETPLGCKHSETTRPVPHRAIYRHVCDKNKPPTGSGTRPIWRPSIREPVSMYVTGTPESGGNIKNSMQFWWCDGSLRSVEDVYGKHAGGFSWRGMDLLQLKEEEVCRLTGKGTYEHWVGVWSGNKE